MPDNRNLIAFALSLVPGILLIISGTSGPIGIYQLIPQKLPMFVKNERLLSIAGTIALILISTSLLGGLVVIAGAVMHPVKTSPPQILTYQINQNNPLGPDSERDLQTYRSKA